MIRMIMVCDYPYDTWVFQSSGESRRQMREHVEHLWRAGIYAKPLYIVVVKPKWWSGR